MEVLYEDEGNGEGLHGGERLRTHRADGAPVTEQTGACEALWIRYPAQDSTWSLNGGGGCAPATPHGPLRWSAHAGPGRSGREPGRFAPPQRGPAGQ